MEAMNMKRAAQRVKPVNGRIYRTAGDESLLVLGVDSASVFVEFADGRFRHVSYREWEKLNPNPSRC
jgi:hypothetical protein